MLQNETIQNNEIQLKPIIEADSVQFSMDTIGWKVLFFLLLMSMVFMAYKYYLNYKNNTYRRRAISEILEIDQQTEKSISALISEIMFQIKQTALQTYDRNNVASLEGVSWLQFLDETGKGNPFSKYQDIITDSVYKNEFKNKNDFNRDDFVKMSINWIKNHA